MKRVGVRMDVEMRERITLTGEIEISRPPVHVKLSGMEVKHEEGAWRAKLNAPMRELRGLARVGPEYASVLALAADADGEKEGVVTIVAPRALASELDAASAELPPTEWLRNEAMATLLVAFERWEPESVGTVTRS